MKRTVIIVSGIPGSGKSHFVREHYPQATVFSADHFVGLYVDGKIQPELIGLAHQECLRNYTECLTSRRRPLIVVDNTNTTVEEVAPYAALAQAFGYELLIVTIECNVLTGAARNTHGAPLDVVKTLAAQLAARKLAPWWPEVKIAQPSDDTTEDR
jgi:predicted kinase